MHPGNIIVQESKSSRGLKEASSDSLRLCLIDAGMTVELLPQDRKNFIDLFHAVMNNNGKQVGMLMIERSRGGRCKDAEKFSNELGRLVNEIHASGLSLGRIGISALLQQVLILCYQHQVKLESRFSSVIIAIGVLEGLGRRLGECVYCMYCSYFLSPNHGLLANVTCHLYVC